MHGGTTIVGSTIKYHFASDTKLHPILPPGKTDKDWSVGRTSAGFLDALVSQSVRDVFRISSKSNKSSNTR